MISEFLDLFNGRHVHAGNPERERRERRRRRGRGRGRERGKECEQH